MSASLVNTLLSSNKICDKCKKEIKRLMKNQMGGGDCSGGTDAADVSADTNNSSTDADVSTETNTSSSSTDDKMMGGNCGCGMNGGSGCGCAMNGGKKGRKTKKNKKSRKN